VGLRRGEPVPALIVPDDETWLAFGDVEHSRYEPTVEPGRAHVLLLPSRLPPELVPAVRSGWQLMPTHRRHRLYDAPLHGVDARSALEDASPGAVGDRAEETDDAHRAPGHHDSHGTSGRGGGAEHVHEAEPQGHGDHDHAAMMAITGEPSADGLVMEDLDVQAGLFDVALPGGLIIAAKLDGDVLAQCQVRPSLAGERAGAAQDVWAAVAWSVAALTVAERVAGVGPRPAAAWLRLAAVEVERAVAQLAWLHQFLRLLAWPRMTGRARGVLRAVASARGALPVGLTTPDLPGRATGARGPLLAAGSSVDELADDLEKSRSFARRTTGLGLLKRVEVTQRGMAGPVARASGVAADARTTDPGYRALGFEPVLREEGDARARALVRAREAAQAVRLGAAALDRAENAPAGADVPAFAAAPAGLVESSRGPVRALGDATGAIQRTAPGAGPARQAAGELAVGREWAAALVTVASFDLSPWQVGP
jgi:hypothetical protein